MKKSLVLVCILPFFYLPASAFANESGSEKKKITHIDDLPRHTYRITGTLMELMNDEEAFWYFASQVRDSITNDLSDYEIEDKTTLKNFYEILVNLNILLDNDQEALERITHIRELEDKPSRKLTNNIINEAIIKTRLEVGATCDTIYKQAFAGFLYQAIKDLPWTMVSERIKKIKSNVEIYGVNVLIGVLQSQYEPAVAQNKQIGNDIAAEVISTYFCIKVILPLKEEIVEVLDRYIAENRIEKPDIWEARKVTLFEAQNLRPVTVAIWDTGVDADVFSDRLFVNIREEINNKDDDGNGYVDDVHGVAYTLDFEKTSELLYPVTHPEKIYQMKEVIKGFSDVESAIDSPEATALKQKIATMDPEDIKPFIEEIMQFALYIHGTYTASLAVEGNPFARVLVARFTVDHRSIPDPPTIEEAQKTAQMYKDIVQYFKDNKVRVVNMSWHDALRETEKTLEVNSIGKDAEERARLAREIFDIAKEALYSAMENAPEVLFVSSAGNANDDVAFEDYYPASFDLPNVLVVGAVDQSGTETGFTSFGSNVDVYANGYEVEGCIPGGDRLPGSGTSASSPNVANLAAKLFALDPSLTPQEVVDLIKQGADRSEDGRLLLIDPKHSVELCQTDKVPAALLRTSSSIPENLDWLVDTMYK